ncbi:MAG: histidine triad nucleotide-binding protein [Chloroflexi bacterium RBG_16_50_9]|nr:MAG: histidine triad nucleotide-binding protein [Chloroflexi bacterium RBG_16_50_9]
MDCIFCKIIAGEIPSAILYRDKDIVAFPDIHPLTPVHLLIAPTRHIPSLAHMTDEETPLVGKMVKAANKLARELNLAEKGYRLTINSGADAGQVVPHLHMHLMGGRALDWKH